MPAPLRVRTIGSHQGDRLVAQLAGDVRTLRRAAGISQARLAAAAGVSRAYVQRIEHTRAERLDVRRAAIILACLGHRLSVRVYPDGPPLRDAAHLRLLARFESRVGAGWSRRREVPVAPADARAWDLVLRGRVRIGVEAETRVVDLQALQRRLALKRRDGHVDRVILLLASTHANRDVVREHLAALRTEFPLDTRSVLEALATGADPRGDGIVLL